MKQVQRLLNKNPPIVKDLGIQKQRTAILMSGRIAPTAIKAVKDRQVILTIYTKKDKQSIAGRKIPPHVACYNLKKALTKISTRSNKIFPTFHQILSKQKKHPLYGQPSFKKWLVKQLSMNTKMIEAYDRLLGKFPIGAIVNYTSLLNI